MNDGLRLLDKLEATASDAGRSDDLAKVWSCFDEVAIYCNIHRADDALVTGELAQLKTGLSKFAADVRDGALSPYRGFRVSITALRRLLDNDVDDDGWPKRGRR